MFWISARAFRWIFAITRLLVRLLRDRTGGRSSSRQFGIRLRDLFVEMGGAAIKIGQQLSVRIDILPYEVCRELEALVDSVPPFPTPEAISMIERAVGRRRGTAPVPLEDIFESFDPTPIGSASIACVYRAVLQSGEAVAVKVRRPGIEQSIARDLGVIELATRAVERLSVVRNRFFEHLRSELRTMLAEELDFTAEARYTRLFRHYTRRDKMRWVTSPRVFIQYCEQDVLVTEFITGISCTDVLAAHENNDRRALAELAAMGITPKKLGKRLMEYSFWSRYESLFFHADPHHGNIIVRENNTMVFIDFGACGLTSRKSRMAQLTLMDRMSQNDISGTVEAAIATLEPLPPLDVHAMKKELEGVFWQWLLAFRDRKSEWWERTTAGLYMALLEETRKRQIPVGLETLRLARSLMLIDTLCFRLYPKMVSPDAFVKYERKAIRRGADKTKRRLERQPWSHFINTAVKETDDFVSRARYVAWQVERVMERIPNEFALTLTKLSTFAQEAGRVILTTIAVSIGLFLYVWLNGRWQGRIWTGVFDVVGEMLQRPIVVIALVIVVFWFYRRIAFRIRDIDIERRL